MPTIDWIGGEDRRGGCGDFRGVAVKEGVENGIASATLTKRVLTLAEAAGASDLTFTTGGAADWVPIGDLTATDGVSARSGTV